MVLGWLALAAVVACHVGPQAATRGRLWLAALGYAVACQIPIYLMRSSRFTALELAQTLRYLPDLVVVLALLCAVGFCAPNRSVAAARRCRRPARVAVVALCGGVRGQQPVFDGDVSDQLARQPDQGLPADGAGILAAAHSRVRLRRCSTRRSTR